MMHDGRRELGRSTRVMEQLRAQRLPLQALVLELMVLVQVQGNLAKVEEGGRTGKRWVRPLASQKQGLRLKFKENSVRISKQWVDDMDALDVVVRLRKEELQPELGQVTNVVSLGWCDSSTGATNATFFKQDNFSDLRGLESTGILTSAAFGAKDLRPISGVQSQICILRKHSCNMRIHLRRNPH